MMALLLGDSSGAVHKLERRAKIGELEALEDVMLVDDPLTSRRVVLEKLLPPFPGVVELATQTILGKKRLYEVSIEGEVNEGVVLKKTSSRYLASETRCLQHPHWLKVKRPEAHLFTR